MAQDNDALIAINGGGFEDPNYVGNGATPLGITFSNGKLITSKTYKGQGGLIGFTQDDKLVLGKMTVDQAKKQKIRDGVTFGPFLIINGKASSVSGNGGWGTATRWNCIVFSCRWKNSNKTWCNNERFNRNF